MAACQPDVYLIKAEAALLLAEHTITLGSRVPYLIIPDPMAEAQVSQHCASKQ
jgi:hypothetical protein